MNELIVSLVRLSSEPCTYPGFKWHKSLKGVYMLEKRTSDRANLPRLEVQSVETRRYFSAYPRCARL